MVLYVFSIPGIKEAYVSKGIQLDL